MFFSNTGRVQVSTLQVSRPVNTGRDPGSVYRALVVERGTAENNEGQKIL